MAVKILMVDDDPLMHQLYQRHIQRAGYDVLGASNGREGLELAVRELPQLIVMDVVMPEMDGLTAIVELKRSAATQAIPVIVISANPQHYRNQREFGAIGAALVLSKPFGAGQLLEAIGRLLPGGALSDAGKG